MDHSAQEPPAYELDRKQSDTAPRVCSHCETPLTSGMTGDFCCVGCRAVHGALVAAGLTRYYQLRTEAGTPVGDTGGGRTARAWLPGLVERIEGAGGAARVDLDLQGMRCAACVWLTEQLFFRTPGAQHIEVNPGVGRLALRVSSEFPLSGFVEQLEAFGYQVGPATNNQQREGARSARDALLLRAGLSTLCALNAMFFAAAIYLGLEHGPLYRLLHGLNFGCATVAVLLGAPVFIGSAVSALRIGLLHLDLPIAVGIVLSYAAAAWSFLSGHEAAAYYDSLAVFVALMLWGRYLQDRLVESNRSRLLQDQGLSGLRVRRLAAGRVTEVAADTLEAGDQVVVPVGEMILVDAILQDAFAQCALDSIDGEATPRTFVRAERIPAGAVNVGQTSIHVSATEAFMDSAALPLLRATRRDRAAAGASASQSPARFSGLYVLAVLGCASVGCGIALLRGQTLADAIGIATAVCVVTCPCSIGIALPLARELVHGKLRQLGLSVRDATFLARARAVTRIAFDKTGTLTDGHLHLLGPHALASLSRNQLQVLLSLVSRSNHPQSRAVERAIFERNGTPALAVHDLQVREQPGLGLSARFRGHDYRLGSADHALGRPDREGGLYFSCDGRALARFDLTERARPAARQELAQLARDGYEVAILSGDAADRVETMARALGLPAHVAHARMRPEDKARWLAEHEPERTLMLGDGINDNLALEQAGCSGTPAIARTSVCARADFYFTSAGLGPVTAALRAARDFHRIAVRNWTFLAVYNLFAVAIAMSGLMKPLWAALVMPVSSTLSIALTIATLQRWSRAWKSSY